jgi:hypothetical protein
MQFWDLLASMYQPLALLVEFCISVFVGKMFEVVIYMPLPSDMLHPFSFCLLMICFAYWNWERWDEIDTKVRIMCFCFASSYILFVVA